MIKAYLFFSCAFAVSASIQGVATARLAFGEAGAPSLRASPLKAGKISTECLSMSVAGFSCGFRVLRRRKASKVISVSLFKGSLGYLDAFQQACLRWPVLIRKYWGKDWNLRIYWRINSDLVSIIL